jgi:serine/threonine-protein kinase
VDFMQQLFRASDPSSMQRNDVTARDLLERGVERVREQFAAQPVVRAELLQSMADAYGGIGLPKESAPLMKEAVDLRRQIGEPLPLVRALTDYADHMRNLDRAAALASLDEADKLLAAADSAAQRSRDHRLARAHSQHSRGVMLLHEQETIPAAEAQLRAAVAVERELLGPAHEETLDSLAMLARSLGFQERFPEAERAIDEVIATLRAQRPLPASDLADALEARGRILLEQKRYPEYLQTAHETLALAQQAHGPAAFVVGIARHNLATALFSNGRYAEAVDEERQAIARARELLPPGHSFLLAALKRQGDCEAAQGHWPAAAAAYAEPLAQYQAAAVKGPKEKREIAALEERLAAVRARTIPAAVAETMPGGTPAKSRDAT